MTNTILRSEITELTRDELSSITGGADAKLDFNAIREQASSYCPTTVAKYSNLDPANVTRGKAQHMGNECLAEMGSFKAAFARGPMQDAIDKAFPR